MFPFYTIDTYGHRPFKIDYLNGTILVSDSRTPMFPIFSFYQPFQIFINNGTVLVRPTINYYYVLISGDIKSFIVKQPILNFCAIVTSSNLVLSYAITDTYLYLFFVMQTVVPLYYSKSVYDLVLKGSNIVYDLYFGRSCYGLEYSRKEDLEHKILIGRTNPIVKFYTSNL